MGALGDFDTGAIIYGKFATYRPSTGATFTLGGTPVLSVYKDNSTTQSTSGVTLTADFDAVTGLNHFAIDTSSDGTFYSAGSFFDVVITTGTVDSVSVTGSVVASFTLRKTSSLKPTTAGRTLDVSAGGEAGLDWANIGSPTTTVNLSGTSTKALEPTTAGRTLDVTATGEAGIDWANIGGPTTSVNLSGTTISTTQAVASVSGNISGSVGSVASGGITAASIADGAIDRATFAADTGLQTIRSNTAQAGAAGTITLDASASATDDFYNDANIYLTGGTGVGQVRHISDYVGSTKVATIKPAWATNPDSSTTFAILPVGSPWDHVTADHLDSGSTGASLNAAGSAGDPWSTALPGAYGAGTAGKIVGDNLNATVSSRATQTSVDTIDDFVDTEVAAIKAKTDQLTFTTANRIDAQVFGLQADTVTAAALATDAGTELADALLKRDMNAVSGESARSPLNALRFLRNKWSVSGTTLTVTKEDDSTTAWTATVTTNASAEPVTGSDPA